MRTHVAIIFFVMLMSSMNVRASITTTSKIILEKNFEISCQGETLIITNRNDGNFKKISINFRRIIMDAWQVPSNPQFPMAIRTINGNHDLAIYSGVTLYEGSTHVKEEETLMTVDLGTWWALRWCDLNSSDEVLVIDQDLKISWRGLKIKLIENLGLKPIIIETPQPIFDSAEPPISRFANPAFSE